MVDEQKPTVAARPKNAARGCLALLLAYVGLPVVGIISLKTTYTILERPIVSMVYGSDSYAKGLRVVGKNGQLSDGRRLPGGWFASLAIGSFIMAMPVLIGYYAILRAKGLWPEGEER